MTMYGQKLNVRFTLWFNKGLEDEECFDETATIRLKDLREFWLHLRWAPIDIEDAPVIVVDANNSRLLYMAIHRFFWLFLSFREPCYDTFDHMMAFMEKHREGSYAITTDILEC